MLARVETGSRSTDLIECAKVQEKQNGVDLVDETGEQIAYVPYDSFHGAFPESVFRG
jgi:hypothetical protein